MLSYCSDQNNTTIFLPLFANKFVSENQKSIFKIKENRIRVTSLLYEAAFFFLGRVLQNVFMWCSRQDAPSFSDKCRVRFETRLGNTSASFWWTIQFLRFEEIQLFKKWILRKSAPSLKLFGYPNGFRWSFLPLRGWSKSFSQSSDRSWVTCPSVSAAARRIVRSVFWQTFHYSPLIQRRLVSCEPSPPSSLAQRCGRASTSIRGARGNGERGLHSKMACC